MGNLHRDGPDLVLDVLVQPRASRDGFAGVLEGRLKIRLAAPPVDGEANRALIAFLAREFGVPKNAVTLENGTGSRRKRVRIGNVRNLPPALQLPTPHDLPA